MMEEKEEVSSRTLHADGEEWIAEVTGQTRSGTGSDAGAPLLYIGFSPARSPASRVREGIAVATSIDDLSDADLEELFSRARSIRTGS